MKKAFCVLIISLPMLLFAQNSQLYQTIRGIVIDQTTQAPLVSANVIIADTNPLLGTSTNQKGEFRINNIPVGRVTVKVGYIGYFPAILSNILIYPGKEVVLTVELEQSILEMEEISIESDELDYMPLNDMATTSVRRFSVEETEKYAGSRGDVARMASNFAGVSYASDDRNDIVIRGNSPSFLLWRLDGVEIPNPNHFAMEGTTGGPVGMLNNNTLSNSDFFTGAFPAEYGNALSGVFDLEMRKGNNEKYEMLGQVGFNGFELGFEGPLLKSNGSSVLLNYRYSTLDLMNKMGMDFGTTGIPKYQDFSGKISWPTKSGRFELFSLWGKSSIAILDSEDKDSQDDLYNPGGVDIYNGSTVGTGGLSYYYFLNENTFARFNLSGLFQKSWTDLYKLTDTNRYLDVDDNYRENKLSINFTLTKQFNPKVSTKVGFVVDKLGYNLNGRYFDEKENAFFPYFDNKLDVGDGPNFIRLFSQWKYKFTDEFVMNSGLHFSHFSLNNSNSLEPRIGFSYDLNPTQSISIGYGLHSRLQNIITYYYLDSEPGKVPRETNLDLGLTKAHHIVLGYDQRLNENTRMKLEVYYQSLYDVPIESESSSYSVVNTGALFGIDVRENLVNKGVGKNYGIEMTLERFYSRGIYFLITGSLFDSKYKASDGVERNTLFDNDYITNVLAGKEFRLSDKNTIFMDAKVSYSGGKRFTPIDLEKSIREGEMEFYEDRAFSQQHPDYYRMDLKVGYRRSSSRITQEWQFYVENVTNRKNVFGQLYDDDKQEIETVYQLGLFPMINYRIYF